jgi:cell fate (sporulation/competence/biofilm development) regulator YlbF (YheA/YmcA/DUF963 family)
MIPSMAEHNEIIDVAGKLGEMLASHTAFTKYRDAQKAVSTDPEAGKLLGDFEKEIMQLARLEQQGMPPTDAQQQKVVALQTRIASNLRIKQLNIAEMDFMDLLRRVNQTMLRPVGMVRESGQGGAGMQGGAGGMR